MSVFGVKNILSSAYWRLGGGQNKQLFSLDSNYAPCMISHSELMAEPTQ